MMRQEGEDSLAIYMEGTANTLRPTTTQVGELFELTEAVDCTDTLPMSVLESSQPLMLKMGFDGCGVTAGLAGVIWAVGLSSQCNCIMARLTDILHSRARQLRVTVLGLSRGAIGALMLAQRMALLSEQHQQRLHVSLCLYDPVPGNLVTTVRLCDWFGLSTASRVMDVSHTPIKRVLAIYPYEPLPDLAFHAPLLPKYPDGAAVEEDATLGCHQGAFYPPSNAHPQLMASCKLSEHRVLAFLETCGVKLPSKSAACARESCALAEQALRHTIKSSRASHAAGGVGSILRHHRGLLLNRHHRELLTQLDPSDRRLSEKAMGKSHDGHPLPEYMLEICRPQAAVDHAVDHPPSAAPTPSTRSALSSRSSES